MTTSARRLLIFLFAMALLAIPTFVVLAKELGKLTVSGPGIKGELTLDDPKELMSLQEAGFLNSSRFIQAPEGLGEGYTVAAYLNLDGKLLPFIEMVYYPTEEGQSGYVHYTGRLDNGSLRTVDQWGVMSKYADSAFRNVLKQRGITLQSAILTASIAAAPAASSALPPSPVQSPYVAVAAIAFVIAAGFLLRRRVMNRRAA